MTDREKLIELIQSAVDGCATYWAGLIADRLIANGVTVQERARPIEEWDEDYGDVLWWKFPIEEPPYVGSPLDEHWPSYHTHWTPIQMPEPPKGD